MKRTIECAIAAGVLALAGSALAQESRTPDPADLSSVIGTALPTAILSGGPRGDPDGLGNFWARINTAEGHLCYRLNANKIATPTAAHIHRTAPAGEVGDVVVTLRHPLGSVVHECTAISPQLAGELLANPAGFTVDIHDSDFPMGSIHGTLRG